MMTIDTQPNAIVFEGVLDENTPIDDLETGFQNVLKISDGRPISLDLSRVARANSSGILFWLRFLKKANCSFKYVNTPVWMVSQFNIISGYFTGDSYVESFQAPFFFNKSQKVENLILRVGVDVPLLQDYSNFKLPDGFAAGEDCEMDFEPQQYFHFLSENCAAFGKYNK